MDQFKIVYIPQFFIFVAPCRVERRAKITQTATLIAFKLDKAYEKAIFVVLNLIFVVQ